MLIAWLMLIAALTPLVATVSAKAGGRGFDNERPRQWLAEQQGWRARANSAQQNAFESLPFFFAAVLFALYNDAAPTLVASLMAGWIVARLAYIALYIAGRGNLRSLVWLAAWVLNIAILFL